MEAEEMRRLGKNARTVAARSVFCYWAARELGVREMELARRLELTRPAVCISVGRGKDIVKEKGLEILGV